jgi:FkbM family methyltransferase
MVVAASVIIPVHDAERTLGDQLSALAGQTDSPEFEVVVVLNRCTDASRSVAESFSGRLDLVLVEAEERASAAYARNVGVAKSSAPILLFCDADDRVDPRWIAEMVKVLEPGGPDFVGGRIVVDRTGLPDWIYDAAYRGADGSCIRRYFDGVCSPISASFGCRREAFEAVRGFDDSFPGAGAEEVDLSTRLLRAGYRIGEAPGALLSYRPRRTLRALLKQSRAYALGDAKFAAKEGALERPPNPRAALAQTVRVARYWIVRERKWRQPRLLIYLTLNRFYRLRAGVLPTGTGGRAPKEKDRVADFAVPPSTSIVGGLALQANPVRARWYATSGIEGSTLALVEALLPEQGVFVDCGANVGVFTLAAALRVGPEGHVIAFEPDPRTRRLLVENLQRHGVSERVRVRPEAVGASATRCQFTQYANDCVSGLFDAPAVSDPGEVTAQILVDVVLLDDAVDRPVDMVKIDVEGGEPEVLAGATSLFERSPHAAVIVEMNPAVLLNAGTTVDALLQHFPSERWALWLIDEKATAPENMVRPFDAPTRAFVESAGSHWYGNILAVPPNRRGEVDRVVERMRLVGAPSSASRS